MRRTARPSLVAAGLTAGLVLGVSACGSSGEEVFEREGNASTTGVAQLQPGSYELDLSCKDKRTSRKVNGKKRKTGSTPTVYFSTTVNNGQVQARANCSGSDTEKFTLSAPTTLNVQATVNGSATYEAKILKK